MNYNPKRNYINNYYNMAEISSGELKIDKVYSRGEMKRIDEIVSGSKYDLDSLKEFINSDVRKANEKELLKSENNKVLKQIEKILNLRRKFNYSS